MTHTYRVSLCILQDLISLFFFFFNDTATTEIYTLSLHDALPISGTGGHAGGGHHHRHHRGLPRRDRGRLRRHLGRRRRRARSEEHTSELQSRQYLVCRLLLEKKKNDEHILVR